MSTSLVPTCTTRPRTTSPSSNSTSSSRYQSSIRSSAASCSPSFRGAPRGLRSPSFSTITPVPPSLFCAVHQGRDGRHHAVAGGRVLLLPVALGAPVKVHGLAEVYPDLRRSGKPPSLRPRSPRAGHVRGDDGRPAQERQHPGARPPPAQPALGLPRRLGEHEQGPAPLEHPERRPQRGRIRRAPPDRPRVERVDEPPE